MVESLIIWAIIIICAFFTGRRFYRQWRAATTREVDIACGDSCTCCADMSCNNRQSQKQK